MIYNQFYDREIKADRLRRQRMQAKREKERKAREKLNAAAPDLLKACKALMKNTRDAVDPYNSNRQFYGALPKYFEDIKAAIAKAETEE